MKAIEITNLRMHCDTCHHEFPGELNDWHNKPCPKCGAPDIITDEDVDLWKKMMAAAEIINEVFGDVNPSEPTTCVTIRSQDIKRAL